ncbi:MAG: hypothetical protein IJ019_03165, partial [Alphaproteobacteria bacterium]|nr:hypothetical protein [Alphaproteobacteria bacterium]
MRKLPLLCMVFAMLLYSGIAQSRICFLHDTDCQAGKEVTKIEKGTLCAARDSSWVVGNKRCAYISYKSVCNDRTGNYYKANGCISGYSDMTDPNINSMYDCSDLECGRCCKDENLVCKEKYKICENPTIPSLRADNETCREKTENAVDKFKYCDCDTKVYKYNTSSDPVCTPDFFTTSGDTCSGDNGSFAKSCSCASNMYTVA